MVTKTLFCKEVKRQLGRIKRGKREGFNFLGFVENQDLTSDVIRLFSLVTLSGATFYNWVIGNEKLQELLNKIKYGPEITYKEIRAIIFGE